VTCRTACRVRTRTSSCRHDRRPHGYISQLRNCAKRAFVVANLKRKSRAFYAHVLQSKTFWLGCFTLNSNALPSPSSLPMCSVHVLLRTTHPSCARVAVDQCATMIALHCKFARWDLCDWPMLTFKRVLPRVHKLDRRFTSPRCSWRHQHCQMEC
jgi:hypothetical protein